jgi:diamine N-acetyltransferase
MHQVFESPHISFVRVSESLVPDYLAMVNDVEHVARLIGLSRRSEPITAEQERRWVQKKLAEDASVFSMLEKRTGAFIGNIELLHIENGSAEMGIAITAGMQEKGYGTEAVPAMVRYGMDTLGLRRIFLKVFPDNARAIHVYEKCGFREYDRAADDVFMEIVE